MTGESGVMVMDAARGARADIWGIMVGLMQIIALTGNHYQYVFNHLAEGRTSLRMRPFLPYIFMAVAAFIVTFVCTPAAKRLAVCLDAVDYPSKRRINTQPIPRLGGLAVFLGISAAMAVAISSAVMR